MSRARRFFAVGLELAVLALGTLSTQLVRADNTPGYPEQVLQWRVEPGETCDDVARALYGDPRHRGLLERYNDVSCPPRGALPAGRVLIAPATTAAPPAASLRAMQPEVRAKPPHGDWSNAVSGQPLVVHHTVNTLSRAHADIRFIDRSRVVLGEHTLVVIYGTASRSAVSRATPRAVQLDQGEVQAGLAALRGDRAVGIAVAGGGAIDAKSRDTVVRRRATRSTVSVFDGSAEVASAGRTVTVPRDFGTSFVTAQPPAAPRPLPPAPGWTQQSARGVVLGPGPSALEASWTPVPKAKAYRLELATDPEFVELVLREEVPPEVTRLRVERLPLATYSLRVRAIDEDDFLGIASTVASVTLAEVSFAGGDGTVNDQTLAVSPYATLHVTTPEPLELALNGGDFAPLPDTLELSRSPAPTSLRLRRRDDAVVASYRVEPRPLRVELSVTTTPHGRLALAAFPETPAEVVTERIRPRVRLAPGPGAPAGVELPLTVAGDEGFSARLPAAIEGSLELIDAHGSVLASTVLDPVNPPQEHAAAPPRVPWLGVTVPLSPLHADADLDWWSPAPKNAFTLATTADVVAGEPDAAARVSAVGRWGRFAVDARVSTPAFGADPTRADGSAWLGTRWLAWRASARALDFGPALRLGLPTTADGPALRAETALAAGGAWGAATWLVNLGARGSANGDADRLATSPLRVFGRIGLTYDLREALRAYLLLDTQGLAATDSGPVRGRGGLAAGAELGSLAFVSGGLRVTPWTDLGGVVTGQLAIGMRAP